MTFSPATPITARWPQEQSYHGGRNGGYAWAHQHGLSLLDQGQPGYLQFWVPILPTAEAYAISPIWNHSPRSTSYLIEGWFQCTASIMEGLYSYQNGHLLWIQICFLCMQYQNYHLCTYRISYPLSWHSTQHCFRQAIYFTTVKCDNGLMLTEFTSPDVFPIILKQLVWRNDGMAL